MIGAETTLREYVTIHRSPFEGGTTSVGDRTLLMAFVHVGHDARIGSRVTVANQTAISGHVIIEDGAVLSGYILIHQFCRIGALAMVGGRTIVRQDIPPFCMLAENECICGPNTIGLRRAGYESAQRMAIRKAIKSFFFHGLNAANALAEIEAMPEKMPELEHFVHFIRTTERGIMPGDPELAASASITRMPKNQPKNRIRNHENPCIFSDAHTGGGALSGCRLHRPDFAPPLRPGGAGCGEDRRDPAALRPEPGLRQADSRRCGACGRRIEQRARVDGRPRRTADL